MSAVEATAVRRTTARRGPDARAGSIAMVPFVVGCAPFALGIGATAAQS
jgi:predicted branched-subunit amino acid permease